MRFFCLLVSMIVVILLMGCSGGNKAVMPNKTDLAAEKGNPNVDNGGNLKDEPAK